jgi:RNA polymerase sigma-70 factor (ECF subfamily)
VTSSGQRTNEGWLTELRGPRRQAALEDLRAYLVRGLGYALKQKYGVTDADIEDFVQDALVKIMDALDTFRGESRFTTWAQKIAVRVALSELRRKRWEDVSLQEILSRYEGDFTPEFLSEDAPTPEQQALRRDLVATVKRVISEELSEVQRQAITAVMLGGMPLQEVARRLGISRNTLYKRLYDARQRLQEALLVKGLSQDEILAAFNGGR